MADPLEPAVKLLGQLLGMLEPALEAGQRDIPYRRQADELRMPHPFRQLIQGERGLDRGRVLSLLELGGQPDPQAFNRQLRLSELGADVEDLARHREGIADVVRSVERPASMQQDGGEGMPVAGAARHRHRPVAELEPLRIRKLGMQPVGEAGENHGPGPAVLLRQLLERLLQECASPGVRTNRRREDTAVAERRPHEQVTAAEAAGEIRRIREPLVSGRVLPRPVVCAGQLEGQLASQYLILQCAAIEQIERSPVVAYRDLGRRLRRSALPGQALIPDRLLGGADARRRAEVVCELGYRGTGAGLQRIADPLVQPGPAALAQPVGDHPPRQGVGEPPPIRLPVDLGDQACSGRLLEEIDGFVVFQRGGRPQDRGVESLTHDRCDRQGRGASCGKACQPPPDQVPDGIRYLRWFLAQPDHLPVERAELRQVPGHLQEKEGVTRGLSLELLHQRDLAFAECAADRSLQERGDVVALKPSDRQTPTVGVTDQGWQDRRELAPLQVNIAIHGHGEDRRGTRGLHQMQQEQEGRPVGPVQVVENEQDGAPGRHPLDPGVQ
jgi:hypothetical protein